MNLYIAWYNLTYIHIGNIYLHLLFLSAIVGTIDVYPTEVLPRSLRTPVVASLVREGF